MNPRRRDALLAALDDPPPAAAALGGDRRSGWSRRTFLKASATAAGGLMLAAHARPLRAAPEPPLLPDLYIRIDPDNRVTLTIPKSEMGQGIRTSLALLIAEELEADWSQVRVETASSDLRYGSQGTGGSGSVMGRFDQLRRIGAAMRLMLIGAAAARWNARPARLRAENGHVIDAAGSRRASFGDLAADAARQPVPKNPPLKPRDRWKLLGKDHIGKDMADIVHGRVRFGLDQRPPGLLFASIERPREFGATLAHVDPTGALAVPGVRQVIEIEPSTERPEGVAGGVAVIAANTWAALEGRRRLKLTWKPGPHAAESSTSYEREMAAALDRPGAEEVNRIGDPDAELARAKRVIRADYGLPFLAHAPLEPMNSTAHWDGQRMTLWSPTQFPHGAARRVANRLSLKPEQVAVHVSLLGGGFGRRANVDFAVEAAAVAHKVAAPVQVMWTREDDFTHDFYRPCARHRLEACLDPRGFPLALRHRLSNPAITVTYRPDATGLGREESAGISDSFYRVPHRKSEYTLLRSGVPRGWWRSVTVTHTIFAIESFVDELAEAAGQDPLAYRLALIDRPPSAGPEERPFAPERMKHCLQLAAERAGWGQPLPPGRGRGLACADFDRTTYAAVVIEASAPRGRPIVHRVVCAVDCGTVIHPDGGRAQVEGSIIHGLSAALGERITVDRGGVNETNFDRYRLLRFHEAPAAIEVHFVDRPDARVTGLGEPALPPVAPALANALYRATGKRLRDLPFQLPT